MFELSGFYRITSRLEAIVDPDIPSLPAPRLPGTRWASSTFSSPPPSEPASSGSYPEGPCTPYLRTFP